MQYKIRVLTSHVLSPDMVNRYFRKGSLRSIAKTLYVPGEGQTSPSSQVSAESDIAVVAE